jgi:hypothetical protein
MSDVGETEVRSGVNLRLRNFPTALIGWLFSPRLSIDGLPPQKMAWGSEFVPLAPGRHSLGCGLLNYTRDTIEFVVPRSGTVSLQWRGPMLHGMAGKWTKLDRTGDPGQ